VSRECAKSERDGHQRNVWTTLRELCTSALVGCSRLHVLNYTSRILFHESDSLNAFKGILACLDISSYWGIICNGAIGDKHITRDFAIDLLWRRAGFGMRRPGFPSWSWTSFAGPIEKETERHMLAGFITEAAQILVEDNDGSRYTLEDLSKSAMAGLKVIPEKSNYIVVTRKVLKITVRRSDRIGIVQPLTLAVG
jgi:hypothetical protein